jgi:MSHA biogenesis protein MshJ
MKAAFQALLAKGDALTQRERTILVVVLMAAAWAIIDTALMSPLAAQREAEKNRMQATQERMQRAQDVLAQQASLVPPDVAAQQRLETARQTFNARMQAAGELQNRMVAPKAMVQVLQGLTRNQPGLKLVRLQTLPPLPVIPQATTAPTAAQDNAGLYKHGVTLTVSGSYDALLRYMRTIESLPIGFYWQHATLDAHKHPDIQLTLTLNTLSLEQQWLTL